LRQIQVDYDPRPIVVGGCYRSGTSLVRRILDSHPRIHCGPEVKLFRDFHADYLEVEDPISHLRFLTTARSLLPEDDLLEILGGALVAMHERAARGAGKPRWADKVPENVVFLEEWERILGERWLFLHVVRNPLDTLASIEEQGFPRSIPAGLDERVELYLEYARGGLRFAERNPQRYVRVLYEDLVTDPEATVRALMEKLGDSFVPGQLAIDAASHQPGLEDPKAVRASRIHRDSVGRWRELLSPEQAARIVAATARTWSRLDPDGRWPLPSPGGRR
jgi:Sulfotransferase family